jgi:hypothetical protein
MLLLTVFYLCIVFGLQECHTWLLLPFGLM